ncbi:MAG: methyltransferase domain-containing protein [Pseudonocardiaceae bacterium]
MGQRALEIGTGTGYQAGLMCHRLGDRNVFSVDIDANLVALAQQRLASIGYRPTLAALDGELGFAEHQPYDHIIATCSVPAVSRSWGEQLAPDGSIIVDFKLAISDIAQRSRHSRGGKHRWCGSSRSYTFPAV